METAQPQQHMTLIVLAGALIAAVAVALVIYFLPGTDQTVSEVSAPLENGVVAVQDGTNTQFDTSLLQRPEYANLDMSLFARGLLPVQPPVGAGKTNLFR